MAALNHSENQNGLYSKIESASLWRNAEPPRGLKITIAVPTVRNSGSYDGSLRATKYSRRWSIHNSITFSVAIVHAEPLAIVI